MNIAISHSQNIAALLEKEQIKPYQGSFLTLYQNISQVTEKFEGYSKGLPVEMHYQPLLSQMIKDSAFFHLEKGSGHFTHVSFDVEQPLMKDFYQSCRGKDVSIEVILGDTLRLIEGKVVCATGGIVLLQDVQGNFLRLSYDQILRIQSEALKTFQFKESELKAVYDSKEPGVFSGQLNYLTQGLKWSPIYRLVLDESKEGDALTGKLTSQVQIINQTDQLFKEVQVQFVSGHLNLEDQPVRALSMERMALASSNASGPLIEQVWEDYKAYLLPGSIDLKPKQHLFVPFMPTKEVKVSKSYEFHSFEHESGFKRPQITYTLSNTQENGLEVAFPKGKFEVYHDKEGVLSLMGQKQILNTPKNEDLHLEVGEAFDLGMKRVTQSTSIRNESGQVTAQEVTVTIELTNAKEKEAEVILKEHLRGNIKLLENPKGFTLSEDQGLLKVKVPHGASQENPHKVSYRYLKTF